MTSAFLVLVMVLERLLGLGLKALVLDLNSAVLKHALGILILLTTLAVRGSFEPPFCNPWQLEPTCILHMAINYDVLK